MNRTKCMGPVIKFTGNELNAFRSAEGSEMRENKRVFLYTFGKRFVLLSSFFHRQMAPSNRNVSAINVVFS